VDGAEPALLEDFATRRRLVKRQSHEQDNGWSQIERLPDERCVPRAMSVRWIRNDCLGSVRHSSLRTKIRYEVQSAIVIDIAGHYKMTVRAQRFCKSA
jgi:hypothetical protein